MATPSRRVSIAILVAALIVDVWVPLTASEAVARCGEGYTTTTANRVMLVSFIMVPTLFALWRCVLHFADEPSRRPIVAVVTAVLVAAAIAGVAFGFAVMDIGPDITLGGDC